MQNRSHMGASATKRNIVYALTLSRFGFTVAVAVLCLFHEEPYNWALWASLFFIALSEFSDFLDGNLARYWGVVSELGKVLDPHADAIAHLVIYWTLAMLDRAWFSVFLVMASRDVLVGLIRIELLKTNQNVSARITGKIKAVFLGGGSMVLMGGPLYWTEQTKPWIIGGVSSIGMLLVIIALVHHLSAVWPALVGKKGSGTDQS